MTSPLPRLVVQQLSRSFTTPAGELDILRDVDLTMSPGEALAITGPSGSGKSTLLYILGLLDAPSAGTVTIDGEEPLSWPAARQARFRNQKIGFVFQDHHLLPQCSVLENVLIPTLADSTRRPEAPARARQLLERTGLAHRLNHRPGQLSGGEKQRVAVCRALINQPLLLLADEPTGNLDEESASVVGQLLLEVAREFQTILIAVTHSQQLAECFPQQLRLQSGRLTEVPV